jgi:hypothetical protein
MSERNHENSWSRKGEINTKYLQSTIVEHYYATSRKVAGTILVDVIVFLNLPNPTSRTVVLV